MENNKKQIIVCQGIPASGKSTWAREFIKNNPNFIIVNKDSIREELGYSTFSWTTEKVVIETEQERAKNAILEGKSVIVDDTNFSKKYLDFWEKLAKDLGCDYSIKKFDVPLEECIERDSKREKPVGRMVITRIYNQSLGK